MCRWVVYMGEPIFLSDIQIIFIIDIFLLIHNTSYHQTKALNHNNDHFSLSPKLVLIKQLYYNDPATRIKSKSSDKWGWLWTRMFSPEPCVFSSVTPPWNNRNLTRICDHVKSPVFFGHVRAATAGQVTEINCHPFQIGRHMFMHNGGIPEFFKYKAKFLTSICDQMIQNIKGTTDTEHIFAYLMNNVPNVSDQQDLEILLWALLRTIRFVLDTTGRACSLNCALTDGVYTIATRFRNGFKEKPPALYYTAGSQFRCEDGHFVFESKDTAIDAVVISSEPLTYPWKKVPSNCMLITGPPAQTGERKFLTARILIGGVVDRCFKKWMKFALEGKNLKKYSTERGQCKQHDKAFLDHLKYAFNWALDSPMAKPLIASTS